MSNKEQELKDLETIAQEQFDKLPEWLQKVYELDGDAGVKAEEAYKASVKREEALEAENKKLKTQLKNTVSYIETLKSKLQLIALTAVHGEE